MTWSIIALDEASGALGTIVVSRFLALGSLGPHGCGGLGLVVTQAMADPMSGAQALRLVAEECETARIPERALGAGPAGAARQLHMIDAGGRDSTALRAALVLSDVLLIPFQPRSYDVWALDDIAGLVDEARSVRDGLRVYAVLNCADPGESSSDNADAAAAVADVPQLEFLQTPLRRRKAFANAAGQGLSVLELKPADKKASDELNALVAALF